MPEKQQGWNVPWFGKWSRCVNSGECYTLGKPLLSFDFYTEFGGFYGNSLLPHSTKSWPSQHFLWLFKNNMGKLGRKCTEASLLRVLCKGKRESTCWKRHESILLHKFPIGIEEVLRVEHVWFLPLWLVFQDWGQQRDDEGSLQNRTEEWIPGQIQKEEMFKRGNPLGISPWEWSSHWGWHLQQSHEANPVAGYWSTSEFHGWQHPCMASELGARSGGDWTLSLALSLLGPFLKKESTLRHKDSFNPETQCALLV